MHLHCLHVSLASSCRRCLPRTGLGLSFSRPSSAICSLLGLLLLAASGAPAFADSAFAVSSASVKAGGTLDTAQVFNGNGCKGGNRSPQLSWRNAPPGTRSFAITVFDQDAPGRGWWHWAVAGIPAGVGSVPENASSSGFLKTLHAVEARNDFDSDGYGGPCPPPGKPHRYVITVYALNSADLRLAQGRPALMFDHEISTVAIGHAQIVVNYGR